MKKSKKIIRELSYMFGFATFLFISSVALRNVPTIYCIFSTIFFAILSVSFFIISVLMKKKD
ncbi:hypothetical protein KAI78_08150 [bacterium]|nr:hypothetical protein [bacterium]